MSPAREILEILMLFSHNDREYCVFSLRDTPYTYLYFSHRERPLRALFFGKDFRDEITQLVQQSDLCIECGLGTRIRGGISLDGADSVSMNISLEEANVIITLLHNRLNTGGEWIVPFPAPGEEQL
jgi:hypothetical protein